MRLFNIAPFVLKCEPHVLLKILKRCSYNEIFIIEFVDFDWQSVFLNRFFAYIESI